MKKILFYTAMVLASAAAAADIRIAEAASEWEVRLHEGARGSITETAPGVYRIVKENALGVLEFRLKKPVLLSKGRWYLRSEYQSRRNAFGTMFFYRLVTDMDCPPNLISSGSRTLGTDTYLANTAKDSWSDRIYSIIAPDHRKYHPVILVIGNPADITVRNMYMTQKSNAHQAFDAPDREPAYTREQVDRILAQRPDATAEVNYDKNGELQLVVNGKTVPPTGYRNEGQLRWEYMFRNEDFHASGTPLTSVTLPVSDIVKGKRKYDLALVDAVFYRALQRSPYGVFFVSFSLTIPHNDWAKENPGEVWRNSKGEIGWGNTSHLKYFSNNPDDRQITRGKLIPWPSYSSDKWLEDCRLIMNDLIRHIMKQPYGKAVAAVQFCGGDDGQFQYRKDDHSAPALRKFHKFLEKKYSTISNLNRIWKSSYKSFSEIRIPEMIGNMPADVPFLGPGVKSDYRMFQEDTGWRLREFYASTVKAAAGKKIVTICWGIPDAFSAAGFEKVPSLDVQVIPQNYPTRHTARPYSMHREKSYQIHKKMYFNELDLRSWRANVPDELFARWLGQIIDKDEWLSMHRKVIAPCFASRLGWWYHTMGYQWGRYFDDPVIMGDIKKVQDLYMQMRALPYRKFRPDVCLVADESCNYFIEAQPYAASGNPNATGNGNGLQANLEVSGVPYDRIYLKDILANPEYQDYKVYIFRHNLFISSAERKAIEKLLKNRNRTLIWMYSTGYVDENSKSTDNMRKLTGFAIDTEEKYARQRVYSVPEHPLNEGRHEVMSYTDMAASGQMPFGLENIWGSHCQIFTPTDLKPSEIIAIDGDGKPAGGYRVFKNWRSMLLPAPNSLTPELLNTIAVKNNCYRAGKAGHNIAMNGNFVSIHPMYDDKFVFITPPGVSEIIDADSGKVIGKAPQIELDLVCGKTIWLFMR